MNAPNPLIDRFGRVHTYLRVSVTDRCNFRCVYCMPEDGMAWMPKADILSYEEIAERLYAAGMRRVNVSLDSLNPERFAALTRGGRLDKVLDGLDAARAAGMRPVKVNAVILRGENDDEVLPLVEHFSSTAESTVLRFIEYMPFEARWHQSVPARELRAKISARYTLDRHEESLGDCLSDDGTPSLLAMLREGADDATLARAVRAMVLGKREGHGCMEEGGTPFEGVMTRVGG